MDLISSGSQCQTNKVRPGGMQLPRGRQHHQRFGLIPENAPARGLAATQPAAMPFDDLQGPVSAKHRAEWVMQCSGTHPLLSLVNPASLGCFTKMRTAHQVKRTEGVVAAGQGPHKAP